MCSNASVGTVLGLISNQNSLPNCNKPKIYRKGENIYSLGHRWFTEKQGGKLHLEFLSYDNEKQMKITLIMLVSRVTPEKAFGVKPLLIVKVRVFLLLLAALPRVSE